MPDRTLKPPRSAAKTLADILHQDVATADGDARKDLQRLGGIFQKLGVRANTTYTFTQAQQQLAVAHIQHALTNPHRKLTKVNRERLEDLLTLFSAEVAATTGEARVTSAVTIKMSVTESHRLAQPLREWHRTHPSAKQPFVAIIKRLDHIAGGAGHQSVTIPEERVALLEEALRNIAYNARYNAPVHRTARHVLTLLRQREAAMAARPLLPVRLNADQLAYLGQAVAHYAQHVEDLHGTQTIVEDAIVHMTQAGGMRHG